ncbi:DNA replication complex GINS family protein [Candidatus Micrarchaeota archaeon]|nr:DNA replication complex GINS family protein [Candidatus Micrarchaeota archaeon]
MEQTSYDELRKFLVQERHSSSVQAVKEDFFTAYEQILEEKKKNIATKFSIEEARAIDSLQRLIQDLRKQRLYKILFKALRDCESSSISGEGLTTQEKELYNELIRLISEYLKVSVAEKKKSTGVVKAKIASSIPEFVGFDGKTYGPFTEGEHVELPEEIASFLAKRNVII